MTEWDGIDLGLPWRFDGISDYIVDRDGKGHAGSPEKQVIRSKYAVACANAFAGRDPKDCVVVEKRTQDSRDAFAAKQKRTIECWGSFMDKLRDHVSQIRPIIQPGPIPMTARDMGNLCKLVRSLSAYIEQFSTGAPDDH